MRHSGQTDIGAVERPPQSFGHPVGGQSNLLKILEHHNSFNRDQKCVFRMQSGLPDSKTGSEVIRVARDDAHPARKRRDIEPENAVQSLPVVDPRLIR